MVPASACGGPAAMSLVGSSALVVADEPRRRKVSEIVQAHATGYGRLSALHADLTAAFGGVTV